MQSESSDPNERNQEDGGPPCDVQQQPESTAVPSAKKSLWGKAKETLGDVSTHASKVAMLSTAGTAKAAEIGKQTIDVASDVTRGAMDASKQAYSGSKLESAVNYVDGELDQRGAKKAIKDTTETVVDRLDQVTGKRLVELLEARLQVQDAYNDILATRLAEALDRIAKLEARFNED